MKRKVISLLVAMAMVFTMTGGYNVAYAKPAGNNQIGVNQSQKENMPKYVKGEAIVLFKSGKNLKSFSPSKARAVAKLDDEFQVKEVWQFKDNATSKAARKKMETKGKNVKNPRKINGDLNIALIKSKKYSTEKLVALLKKNPAVEKVEPNRYVHAMAYTDSYYNHQWGLENKGQNGGTVGVDTNPQEKWKEPSSEETVVAVVDSGVDYTHPDLKNKMWKNKHYPDLKGKYGYNYAYYSDDPMDDNGHGTHCAGIIAGDESNNIGIRGINPNAKIMALKFLDFEGNGTTTSAIGCYYYIDRALDLGVNVSAINNSWGGGGYDYIIDTIVTRVGEKGAVSCFASGNEKLDVDKDPYALTVSSDNPYSIVVNAVNEQNQLTTFSNYGKETTSINAPGADILSTVSYPCYNPSIYSPEKRALLSEKFNDFEGENNVTSNSKTNEFGIPKEENVKSELANSNLKFKSEIVDNEYFGTTKGHSLKFTLDNTIAGEMINISFPYKRAVLEDTSKAPFASAMIKGENDSPEGEGCIVMLTDVPKGKAPKDLFQCEELFTSKQGAATTFSGKENFWNHLTFQSMLQPEDSEAGIFSDEKTKTNGLNNMEERELVFSILVRDGGKNEIYIDNLGFSKIDVDKNELEKYDFYNGTSMAAPFVTGAVAMLGEEAKARLTESNKSEESLSKINYLLKHIKKDASLDWTSKYSGSLDLSQKVDNGPVISSIDTDFDNKHIIIKGFGFDNPQIQVKINGTVAKIVEKAAKKIVVEDQKWLNNVVNIEITVGDAKVIKKNVYLVHSKKKYDKVNKFVFPSTFSAIATDGKNLYIANSETDDISKINPKTGAEESLANVPMDKYFNQKDNLSDENIQYKFTWNLASVDGKLYTVIEKLASGDIENEIGGVSSYSSKYKLISIDKNSGKVVNLGDLPKSILQTEDYSIGAYNGNLYFAGGYDYNSEQVSNKVNIYNPRTKKWSKGPSMPEGRGGGILIQSGNDLIYTLGYSEGTRVESDDEKTECPEPIILSGGSWQKIAPIKPLQKSIVLNKGGEKFNAYSAAVGVCKEGLVYAGIPVEDLGDTFIYNRAKGKYEALPYQMAKESTENFYAGLAIGNYFYGTVFEDSTYGFKINSGNVAVKAGKYKGGKIIGANNYVTPGNQIKIKVVPNKGYKLKEFTIDGVKQNVKTITTKGKYVRLTKHKQAIAKFVKVKK